MTATRRQAREWAIQMLTAADLNPPEDVPQFMLSFWEELASLDEEEGRAEAKGKLREFAEARVVGVLSNLKEIDGILVPLLDNWDLSSLSSTTGTCTASERSSARSSGWGYGR